MNPQDITARFDFASSMIRDAGALAAKYFADIASLTVKNKGPQDLVSEADYNTEVLIRDRLKAAFPSDAFFGEETGPTALEGATGVWVVDPIDGTQPFLNGMAHWCVSIAFIVGRTIEIGLVFDPIANELFAARRGQGASLNGKPINVRQAKTLGDGVVSVGYSMRAGREGALTMLARLLEQGGVYHRAGSGALGLCYVACGRLIGYVELHMNSWDCLAALLLITEGGGQVNDFLAGDALAKGNRVIAGGPAIYGALEALFP